MFEELKFFITEMIRILSNIPIWIMNLITIIFSLLAILQMMLSYIKKSDFYFFKTWVPFI